MYLNRRRFFTPKASGGSGGGGDTPVVKDWGVDAANEYTPYTGRNYITDISTLTSSAMTLNYTRPNGSSGTLSSGFLRTSGLYGNPSQGIAGFRTWMQYYTTVYGNKFTRWDDIYSDLTILDTWENTLGVQITYGWMGDLSSQAQDWGSKYTTKKIAAFKNCNLLGIIVMDGDLITPAQYCNASVKAWDGIERTVDGRPCVSFDPNTTIVSNGILIAIVYTEN